MSKVLQFEKAYADHIGVKHALAVTSGTTALFTAVAALEIGPGDEVILPAWTWYADYDAIVLGGALPVFVEIDESFNKVTYHAAWPSFQSPEGKAIRYGRECCPCTIDIIGRYGGVIMDPQFTDGDLRDIVTAIRKAYSAMNSG